MHQSELFGKTISVSRARGSTMDKKRAVWEKEADTWVEDVETERAQKLGTFGRIIETSVVFSQISLLASRKITRKGMH